MKVYRIFAFLIFFVYACFSSLNIHSVEPGVALILYGTACSGKSTLAESLEKNLKGNFTIEKKTKLVEEKQRELLQKYTGKNYQDSEQILAATVTLPPKQRSEIMNITRKALDEKVNAIAQKVLKGKNIIFDVCLKSPEEIKKNQTFPAVYVLVYASIPTLSKRDILRTEHKEQGSLFQQKRRRAILSLYSALYRPGVSGSQSPLGEISRKDVDDFYAVSKENLEYKFLKHSYDNILNNFNLHKVESIPVEPQVKPDILIHTDKQSTEESIKLIEAYLQHHGFVLKS